MEKQTKIQITTSIGQQLIDPHQIISVCPLGRNSIAYLEDDTKILAFKGIEEMEKLLDYPYFFRCHRNCIINLLKISMINHGYTSLQLHCGKEIQVSKHRKDELKQELARFCKSNGGGNLLILN